MVAVELQIAAMCIDADGATILNKATVARAIVLALDTPWERTPEALAAVLTWSRDTLLPSITRDPASLAPIMADVQRALDAVLPPDPLARFSFRHQGLDVLPSGREIFIQASDSGFDWGERSLTFL